MRKFLLTNDKKTNLATGLRQPNVSSNEQENEEDFVRQMSKLII